MMKTKLLIGLMLLMAWGASAQSSKLIPGASFTNQTADTLYVIPMQQVRSLLTSAVSHEINSQKLELYKKQISLFEERSAMADSAIAVKKLEADFWHGQLLQNDQTLENQRIENIKLIDDKNRIRQSRVYYLVAGLVAGAVLVSL